MKNRELKKSEIIRKGLEVMFLNGYFGTGVKQITDAAGIPKGSFYNYFDSKEDFAIEALKYYVAESCSQAHMILSDTSLKPLARLRKAFSLKIDEYSHKWKYSLGDFVGNLSQEMGDINEKISKELDKQFGYMKEPLATCLREAQNQGELDAAHDTEQLAEFIINSWNGTLIRMKASRNSEPLENFVDVLFNVVLK